MHLRHRISLVHFLNAAPLGWSFAHGPHRHQFEVLQASPAKCADQLAGGEADVGLIPSIEYQRISNLRVIPGVAIAATNEVRSVLLVRPRGIVDIRSVALDTSSRTSVCLLKLLLQQWMGIHPEYVPHAPDVTEMLRSCDAALIIGDTALRCSTDEYEILDLAAAWKEWQGLPFVFAFWACRKEASDLPGIVEVFQQARDWGVSRIVEIADEYAKNLDLPAPFLERYLRQNLDHTMNSEHILGLQRFYRLAFDAGLIETLNPLRFVADREEDKH
jgi:chorismate dehydratase